MGTPATKALFDVDSANRVLPLVRTIVRDMVTEFRMLRTAGREQRALQVESRGSTHSELKILALRDAVNEASSRIEGYLRELEELGLEVRDLELGLVDFPTVFRGEPAYLCWRHDEPDVAFWHPAGKGFSDRTPLPTTSRATV